MQALAMPMSPPLNRRVVSGYVLSYVGLAYNRPHAATVSSILLLLLLLLLLLFSEGEQKRR